MLLHPHFHIFSLAQSARIMKRLFFLLAAFVAISASACTNFLVGKKASKTGATFISYNMDSYGMYGVLKYYPAGKHAAGEVRRIVDGDTNHYLRDIPEASETYAVMGLMNEFQLSIMETTFGGREELYPKNPEGGIDYPSLMALGLQRAKTAREAIQVMGDLVDKYGYSGEGESFSVADPNEIWILEMIGKGDEAKGAVWVAVRIPDDCIAAHANQSRIHKFAQSKKIDKKLGIFVAGGGDVMYSKDVITFAREKGYFNGNDADFSFADAYAPADFGSQRFCDARAWSFFNRFVDGMDRYVDFVDGRHIGTSEVMPLYFKPNRLLDLSDVIAANQDHYEGTPFDFQEDINSGVYQSAYLPTPLTYEYDGKKYFNERPISTQQSACTFIAQMRGWLPNEIGGVLWFGNDEPNMVAYTPMYCGATRVPECYAEGTADDHTFSWKSAFWVCNWVANMTYPRYSVLFPAVKAVRDELQQKYISEQANTDAKAQELLAQNSTTCRQYLTDYSVNTAQDMLTRWKELGEYLIVKFNDQAVKKEKDGKFELTEDGICVSPERPGFPQNYRAKIVKETGTKYQMPE